MWLSIFFLLVHWNYLLSLPLDEHVRQTRQPGECCPCPTSPSRSSEPDFDTVPDTARCPCLESDSEGAPSMLFPTAVRAARPYMKESDTKEDLKPLLSPEVGLASSVLNTLREVTDEEYEDALARDAAKSAARALDSDDPQEAVESANNVVAVIFDPMEDDNIPDGSHVHEMRCLQPLGNEGNTFEKDKMSEPTNIFGLPKVKPKTLSQRKMYNKDNGVGASNVEESIVNIDKDLDGSSFTSNPSLLSLFPNYKKPVKYDRKNNVLGDNGLFKKTVDHVTNVTGNVNSIPKLKLKSFRTLPFLFDEEKNKRRLESLKRISKLKDVEMIPSHNTHKAIFESAKTVPNTKPNHKINMNRDKSNIYSHLASSELVNLLRDDEQINEFNRKETINKKGKINTNSELTRNKMYEKVAIDTAPSPSELHLSIPDTDDNSLEKDVPFDSENMDISRETIPTDIDDDFNSLEPDEHNSENNVNIFSQGKDRVSNMGFTRDDCKSLGDSKINATDYDFQTKPGENLKTSTNSDSLEDLYTDQELDDQEDQDDDFKNEVLEYPLNTSEENDNIADKKSSVVNNDENDMECEFMKNLPDRAAKSLFNEMTEDENRNTETVSIQDLQKMSDKILDLSLKKGVSNEKSSESKSEADIDSNKSRNSVITFEVNDEEENELENSNLQAENSEEELQGKVDNNVKMSEVSNEHIIDENILSRDAIEKVCRENFDIQRTSEEEVETSNSNRDHAKSHDTNEMLTEASDSILNILPRVSLNPLQPLFERDSIVQPFSLTDRSGLNLFGSSIPGISDLLNLNTQLPTLEDIRSRISSIFDVDDRETEDEEFIPDRELEGTSSNNSPLMAADASTSSFKTALPSIKPLDQINLDIFQLKPWNLNVDPLASKIPTLNLNRYKAKLPIPKELDLKPVKLESSVKNKAGILGASLTFGSEKGSSNRAKSNFNLNPKGIDLLGDSIVNIPRLDDLGAKLRETSESLLGKSIPGFGRNAFGEVFQPNQAFDTITENLRAHSESAMRNIQELGSTLQENIHDFGLLGKSQPHDLLHLVSNAHEDLSDKLKGIQYDLNDRFEAFHDKIADQFRIPSHISSMITPRTRSQARFKLGASPLKLDNRRESEKLSMRKTKSYPRSKTASENSKYKTKMQSSASEPVPLMIKQNVVPPVPFTLKSSQKRTNTDNDKPNLLRSSPRNGLWDPIKQNNDLNQLIWGPPLQRHSNNKIKITFPTTTVAPLVIKPIKKPIILPKSKTITSAKTQSGPKEFYNSFTRSENRRSGPVFGAIRKPELSDSLKEPRRKSTQFRQDTMSKTIKHSPMNMEKTKDDSLVKSKQSHLKMPTFNNFSKTKLPTTKSRFTEKEDTSPVRHNAAWPKVTESSFLSKVRDAVRARLADINKTDTPKYIKNKNEADMKKSASENMELVDTLDQPVRENTSYRCKMICNKDSD